MIQSSGVLVKTPDITIWQGNTTQWPHGLDLLGLRWASYGAIYRSHLWVAVLVNKIANAAARLPYKVYERTDQSRNEVPDHPYARLMRRPNSRDDPFLFWSWTVSTLSTYGEAFWGKVRDRGGRPVELIRLHPAAMHDEWRDGRTVWTFDNGRLVLEDIPRRDLVHFRFYNPDSDTRGLSPLEPLRQTLENEEGARKANTVLWRHGGRPSVVLRHPKTLSDKATERLSAQWQQIHGGVDNWAKAAVLEEGMEAQILPLNVEELQYIEARKLNREEYCAIYDVPPPVVHILDRATFSNVVEQHRSMYRDTMAPKVKLLESTCEFELRDGRMGENREPDFSDGVYGEFLMDEVLRGDFEVRVGAIAQAIQTGQLTMAEAREMENRPFIEGSDRLLVNAALVEVQPADDASFDRADLDRVNAVGQLIRAGFEPEASASALGLPAIPHTGLPPVTVQNEPLTQDDLRAVMGRLSRVADLNEVNRASLIEGLNGSSQQVVTEFEAALAAGETVAEFKQRLRRCVI